MRMQTTWSQRMGRTHVVMSAAWCLLKEDKKLLLLPIASTVCLVLLVAGYLAPTIVEIVTGESALEKLRQTASLSQAALFLSYVVTYAIGIFFNAALASCVLRRMDGQSATIRDGVGDALSCVPQILGWAIVSATVGLLLKVIERRSGWIGGLVAGMIGLVWSVGSFLVVPILVAERKGPFDALEESVRLLRHTWGENLLAGICFGALYFLWSLPGMFAFVIGAGLIFSHQVVAIILMLLALLYFPLLGLLLSTMSTIFDVVLYRYAKHRTITPGFDRELLDASFANKLA
jgi:Family of unknown function (DUF6159)